MGDCVMMGCGVGSARTGKGTDEKARASRRYTVGGEGGRERWHGRALLACLG